MGPSLGGGSSSNNYIQDVGIHEKNGSSVREYCYTEDKNYKFRPGMEDSNPFITFNSFSLAYCVKDKLGGEASCGLFAVFDGHGGKQVADHCADRLPEEMKKEVMKTPGDLCYNIE